jgi:hypothetical protein
MEYQDKFCQACGQGLIKTAVVCTRCGSPAGIAYEAGSPTVKSKTTAVVLAVFFGPWSWLYTYAQNKVKFWVAFPFMVIYVIIALFAVLAIVSFSSSGYYSASSNISNIVAGINFFVNFPLWLWALIDNARKPQSFYMNYVSR